MAQVFQENYLRNVLKLFYCDRFLCAFPCIAPASSAHTVQPLPILAGRNEKRKLQILKASKKHQQLTWAYTNHCPGRRPWFGLVTLQPSSLLWAQVCQREDEPRGGACRSVGVPLWPGVPAPPKPPVTGWDLHLHFKSSGDWAAADLGQIWGRVLLLCHPLWVRAVGTHAHTDTCCPIHCKNSVITHKWGSKTGSSRLQPRASEMAPTLKPEEMLHTHDVPAQNQPALRSLLSQTSPISHRWLPDKMAISCLRKIMWKHSNNLVLKHQLVNALVSHASTVQFLGVN